jgi:hypothetical protein
MEEGFKEAVSCGKMVFKVVFKLSEKLVMVNK